MVFKTGFPAGYSYAQIKLYCTDHFQHLVVHGSWHSYKTQMHCKLLCGWCRAAISMHCIFSYFLHNLQMIWIFSLLGCLKQAAFSISKWGGPCHSGVHITDATLLSAIPEQVRLIHSKMFLGKLLTEQVWWPDFQRRHLIHLSKYLHKRNHTKNIFTNHKRTTKLKGKMCNCKSASVQVHLNKLECREKVHFSNSTQIVKLVY